MPKDEKIILILAIISFFIIYANHAPDGASSPAEYIQKEKLESRSEKFEEEVIQMLNQEYGEFYIDGSYEGRSHLLLHTLSLELGNSFVNSLTSREQFEILSNMEDIVEDTRKKVFVGLDREILGMYYPSVIPVHFSSDRTEFSVGSSEMTVNHDDMWKKTYDKNGLMIKSPREHEIDDRRQHCYENTRENTQASVMCAQAIEEDF